MTILKEKKNLYVYESIKTINLNFKCENYNVFSAA